ncbi:hypothetical protein bhYOR_001436 (plasmid) [Borrelia nietonii YOR]|uniref:BDR-repeat family protein n=1 Tax=Borrelia hermsii MTW TaxID=1313291 RepID=W5T6H7_BORHE|nr:MULTISPECIES: hypothetical protein [Borrelia]AHH14807.1 BDR-repeat family protein [Borrelia hermsii MTW]UPA10069.1 hypothetical protein bhYOR_001436 [Borrelia nietonii YOR]
MKRDISNLDIRIETIKNELNIKIENVSNELNAKIDHVDKDLLKEIQNNNVIFSRINEKR